MVLEEGEGCMDCVTVGLREVLGEEVEEGVCVGELEARAEGVLRELVVGGRVEEEEGEGCDVAEAQAEEVSEAPSKGLGEEA